MRQQALRDALGAAVRDARTRQGLTQAGLADRLGLQRTSITNIESGVQGLSVELLVEIASALGAAPQELLTRAIDLADPAPAAEQPVDLWVSNITRASAPPANRRRSAAG